MRPFLGAISLLAGLIACTSPARADRIWQGVSVAVPNEETGLPEFYTVRFTLDDSAPRFITPLIAQNPEKTPYVRALYENVTAISVSGPGQNVSLAGGTSYVSTLATNLSQFGSVPFLILAGTDGFTPGFQMQFSYAPPIGYGSTAIPGSLTIGSPAIAGFNLQRYDYDGDPADEVIGDPVTLLNFFFASGGFVPAATAVPEPASWAMMIVGFGVAGGTMRRRRRARVALA